VTFEEGGACMTIGAGAFASCGLLTGIELPACTTEIGESAFEDAGLTAFVIPEQVAHLKQNVLKNTKITEINIPANAGRTVMACSLVQSSIWILLLLLFNHILTYF
jgi:hypothetical protein